MQNKSGVLSRFILLLSIFIVWVSWSCARYPHIPKVRDYKESEKGEVSMAKKEEALTKRASLIPHLEGKQEDYTVGPEDVLEIIVWDHDDLTREVRISREGEFSYPMIGKVDANGLTVSELEKKITDKLSGRFIVNPQLTIEIKEMPGECFFVYGEVEQPGRYDLIKSTTILKAIATAGGVTERAALRKTKIVRERGEKKIEISVEMTDLIEAQDIIMVPKRFF